MIIPLRTLLPHSQSGNTLYESADSDHKGLEFHLGLGSSQWLAIHQCRAVGQCLFLCCVLCWMRNVAYWNLLKCTVNFIHMQTAYVSCQTYVYIFNLFYFSCHYSIIVLYVYWVFYVKHFEMYHYRWYIPLSAVFDWDEDVARIQQYAFVATDSLRSMTPVSQCQAIFMVISTSVPVGLLMVADQLI